MSGKILILYHFFYPDDVVSSRHFSDFAEGLADLGWNVTVLTSNRFCRDPHANLKTKQEVWKGVKILRSYRPGFRQSGNVGRILNSVWMMIAWLIKIIRSPSYDAIVIGTDPQFSYFIIPIIKLFKRHTKIAYWCYDLYPEAIIASKMGGLSSLARFIKPITKFCYKQVDLMVDIGSCMRSVLSSYKHSARCETLVPWALVEPPEIPIPDEKIRNSLFGKCSIAILYSGTIGNAHTFTEFLLLARELRRRNFDAVLCFAGRGNRYDVFRDQVKEEDTNIRFAGFAKEDELEKRLAAADMHMVSLRDGWEGIVVPSKFFGSLAAGKPVIFAGAEKSSIKRWIQEHRVGFCLGDYNVETVADNICSLASNNAALAEMQKKAFSCYKANFSKKIVIKKWSDCLEQLIASA